MTVLQLPECRIRDPSAMNLTLLPHCATVALSITQTIATTHITSRLDYWNSFLYNFASKDIAKLQCVQNCLSLVITRYPQLCHSEIASLASCSISHHLQMLYHCLSNAFFRRIFTSISHAFSSNQAQNVPLFWFLLAVCSEC